MFYVSFIKCYILLEADLILYRVLQVEGMNNLISEVAIVSAQEQAMLDECEALLAFGTSMQVRAIAFMNLNYAVITFQFYDVEYGHKLVGNTFNSDLFLVYSVTQV
jgi:hypothetical protein